MGTSNSVKDVGSTTSSTPAHQFRQPDNCSVAVCSAIALYEQELERHRATEAQLRNSVLRETELLRQKEDLLLLKDILAKESEHRLLNGLQLITSLLTTQSRGTSNADLAAQLTIAANRVSTLARVHRHLHMLEQLEGVEFKHYLEKLCADLSEIACIGSSKRNLCVEGVEMRLPRATATPLAFIASEMITNSIKYAEGKIAVSLQLLPNGIADLSVSDDGPGLPAEFDPAETQGLGMKIIAALIKQIHGTLSFTKGDLGQGTRFSVRFRAEA